MVPQVAAVRVAGEVGVRAMEAVATVSVAAAMERGDMARAEVAAGTVLEEVGRAAADS